MTEKQEASHKLAQSMDLMGHQSPWYPIANRETRQHEYRPPTLKERQDQIRDNWGTHEIKKAESFFGLSEDIPTLRKFVTQDMLVDTEHEVRRMLPNCETPKRHSAEILATALAIWYGTRSNTSIERQIKINMLQIMHGTDITTGNRLYSLKVPDFNMSKPARDMSFSEIVAALITEEFALDNPQYDQPQLRAAQFYTGRYINKSIDRNDSPKQVETIKFQSVGRLVEAATADSRFSPDTKKSIKDADDRIVPYAERKGLTDVVDLTSMPPNYPGAFNQLDTYHTLSDGITVRTVYLSDKEPSNVKGIILYSKGKDEEDNEHWYPVRQYTLPGFNKRTHLPKIVERPRTINETRPPDLNDNEQTIVLTKTGDATYQINACYAVRY